MAYKFQIGQAALSGALEQAGEITFLNGKGPDGQLDRFPTFVALEDGNVDIPQHNGTVGLMLGSAVVTSTAAELNLLDTAAAGSVVNSRAVIYSAAGVVQGTDFKGPNGFDIGNAAVADFMKFDAAEIVIKDGTLDFDIASHDATNGLKLGGTLVSATAAELNLVDGSSAGTAVASKAAIYNATKGLNAIQVTASWLSAVELAGEMDASGENIIGINDLGVDGVATFNGNVDLGNATTDTITATGRFDSALVPSTDSERNLGTPALRWSTIYVDSIVGADIAMDTEQYGAAPLGSVISGAVDFALIKSGSTTGLGGAIYTLPTCVAGKVLHVKLSGSQANVTVKAAADDAIEDGAAAGSIFLESTGSAVTLVGMDATHWFIV